MKKIKLMMVALVALGFVAVPISVLAGGYPPGDNSWAIVGVPKGWAPKVAGQAAGQAGGKKWKGDNSVAIVGVPKGWAPSTDAASWSSSGTVASRTKGNSRAIVGVPKGWTPK